MIVLRLPARVPLRGLISVLLGVLHAIAFRNDAGWPVELVALAALFALIESRTDWLAVAGLGFAFGLGWFCTGIYWIYISIHTYGLVAAPLAALATFLLSAYLSLYPAFACGAASFWCSRVGVRSDFLKVIAPLWMLAELARGFFLTGFPWMGSGYAHVGGPLRGYAPVLGVYGTTLCAALVAAALARLARAHPRLSARRTVALLGVIVGLPLLGSGLAAVNWSHPIGQAISVRLLQGNVAQEVKFEPEQFDAMLATYFTLIEQKPADLIVLPETVLPLFLNDVPAAVIDRLRADAVKLHAALVFGAPIADRPTVYTNSVLAFTPDQRPPQRYDKSHLVPFGEFVPLGFRWFVDLMRIPLGDFTPGRADQRALHLAQVRIAFNICYEDLFGEEIIRQAAEANILVNMSNVAWFGDSQALPQHLQLSRMRAIETARPMLRATNTGMTASVDVKGQVLAALKPYTTGSLDVEVQPVTGTTPYVSMGDGPVLALGLLLLGATAFGTLKRRGSPSWDQRRS